MPSRSGRSPLDGVRSRVGAAQGHVIDELLAGRLGRREFLRRATVLGMSIPLAGGVLAACAGEVPGESAGPAAGSQQAGGTLRNAVNTPTAAIDPTTVADNGGLVTMCQVGEYLAYTDSSPELRPVLAERWAPDDTGRVWTFDIRPGVRFHDGAPLTVADVVATFERLADPANGSNALSVFSGVLSAGATRAQGDTQVVFELDKPTVNFPYLVSSQNYNSMILPASYDPSRFTEDMMGTGPFRFESYTPGVGATFVANPDYWDASRPPFLERIELKYYSDLQPQILALQGGEVDVVSGISFSSGRGLLADPNFTALYVPSSYTRHLSMRTDQAPFDDARVRRALALALDRPAALRGLLDDRGELGNDSPFAPSQATTDTTVAQRALDLAQARALLAEAGYPDGIDAVIAAPRTVDIPDLAVTIQNAAREIGMRIELNVMAPNDYYGDATFGASPWLDSQLSLVDYGHRSVPDVVANAALRSDGVWNAAHYNSPQYDALFDDYSSQLDVGRQKEAVGAMQRLLLEDTPIIVPYFLNWLGATANGVQGVNLNPTGQLDLSRASIA